MSTHEAHKTRDHRFAYISRGNITGWARGTTRPVYPEPKAVKVTTILISSKAACVLKPVANHAKIECCVMVAPPTSDKTVRQEIDSCERSADRIDAALAIADLINRRFGLIK